MIEWTGERYVPWVEDKKLTYEHLQRYYYAKNFVKGRRVLDLASGEGYGANILSEDAESVAGVDISPEAVRHASSKYIRDNLRYFVGDITAIPIEGMGVFDVITCFEALEHIEDHDALLREVKRLLKPEGIFLISTPNKLIYSDIPKYTNKFHLKELYFDEFRDLLGGHFAGCYFYGQKVSPLTSLFALFDGGSPGRKSFVSIGDKGFHEVTSAERQALYFVAVASDGGLGAESLPSEYEIVDVSDSYFKWMESRVAAAASAAAQKSKRVEDLDRAFKAATGELEAMKGKLADTAQLKASIGEKDAYIKFISDTHAEKNRIITSLKDEVAALNIRAGKDEVLKLELASKEETIRALNLKVSEMESEIGRMRADLGEVEARYKGQMQDVRAELMRLFPDKHAGAANKEGDLKIANMLMLVTESLLREDMSSEAANALGEVCYNFGSMRAAQTFFTKALAAKPSSTDALNNLGMIGLHLGDKRLAADLFKTVLDRDADDEVAAKNLRSVTGGMIREGEMLFAEGKQDEAMKKFVDVADLDPRNWENWNNLGVALMAAGLNVDAEKCFLTALELNEGCKDAEANLRALRQRQRELPGRLASPAAAAGVK